MVDTVLYIFDEPPVSGSFLFNTIRKLYFYINAKYQMPDCIIKRTTTGHPDFAALVSQLGHELWNELNEDQSTYDQYNKVPGIKTAVIVYFNNKPAAIGCFKEHSAATVEIKRMFTAKVFRGNSLSKKVLNELEQWAIELGYHYAVLETSIYFEVAKNPFNSCSKVVSSSCAM